MTLRSLRERVLQTCAFEIGGLLLVVPLYAVIFQRTAGHSALLIAALSVTCLIWTPIYNCVFDWVEMRAAARVASDRPHRWRAVHAISLEVSVVAATLPMVMVLGGHGFREALVIDLGLTAFYTCYAYLFHLGFDRLRPVPGPGAGR